MRFIQKNLLAFTILLAAAFSSSNLSAENSYPERIYYENMNLLQSPYAPSLFQSELMHKKMCIKGKTEYYYEDFEYEKESILKFRGIILPGDPFVTARFIKDNKAVLSVCVPEKIVKFLADKELDNEAYNKALEPFLSSEAIKKIIECKQQNMEFEYSVAEHSVYGEVGESNNEKKAVIIYKDPYGIPFPKDIEAALRDEKKDEEVLSNNKVFFESLKEQLSGREFVIESDRSIQQLPIDKTNCLLWTSLNVISQHFLGCFINIPDLHKHKPEDDEAIRFFNLCRQDITQNQCEIYGRFLNQLNKELAEDDKNFSNPNHIIHDRIREVSDYRKRLRTKRADDLLKNDFPEALNIYNMFIENLYKAFEDHFEMEHKYFPEKKAYEYVPKNKNASSQLSQSF